jgi:hypothetical protein
MQPLAFDPLEFVRLASTLAASSGESELRAAVGRAYYGLFLLTREKLSVQAPRNVHNAVVTELKRKNRTQGDQLDRLRRLRVRADYYLRPRPVDPPWPQVWKEADALVRNLLPRLQQLP